MSGRNYDPVKAADRGDHGADVEDELYKKTWSLGVLGVVSLLVALANFSICIWIRFDLDFWEWVIEIQWYTYWNAMYVVLFAMLFHAINAGVTLYATFTESRTLLLVSAWARLFIWFLTLAGAIVICMYGVEESDMLVKELNDVFMSLIHRWDTDERASRVMVQIQEYVGCCGANGNRDDYINAHKPVPVSCRHPVTGNCYGWGCGQTLAYWLEPWTCCLAGMSLGLCGIVDPYIWYLTHRLRTVLALMD